MKKLAGMLVGLAFFLCAVAAQAQCTLGEALDAPALSWSTGGTLGGGPGGSVRTMIHTMAEAQPRAALSLATIKRHGLRQP